MFRQNRGGTKSIVVSSVIVVLLIGGVVFWWLKRNSDDESEVSPTEAAQLVQLAEEANACLENESFRAGFELAEQRYLELKERLPDDPLAFRNHVILRILYFASDEELRDDQEYLNETDRLVEELIAKDPESFESYLLAVRWRYLVHYDIDETDVELLEEACKFANGSPIPHYEFFDRTIVITEDQVPDIEAKRREHLAKAYALQPDNLKLSLDYLQQLAETSDPKFSEVWQEFKQSLGPIVIGADLEAFVEDHQQFSGKVDQGVEQQDWSAILLNVRRLANLIKKGEVQKIDLSKILPYELDFLVTRLGDKIVSKLESSEATTTQPGAVSFESSEVVIEGTDREILSVKSVDFDLDQELEFAVLFRDGLEIFDRQGTSQWTSVIQFPLDRKFSGLMLADLDYDTTSPKAPVAAKPDAAEATQSRTYADPDVVLYGQDGILVLENRYDAGKGRVLNPMQTKEFDGLKGVLSATLVDLDHDKDLDLVVGTESGIQLFLSRGNLSFFDFTEFSVLPSGRIESFDIVDLDRDIDIDVVVSRESAPAGYLENLGHGRFRFQEFKSTESEVVPNIGIQVLDVDSNRSWDLIGFGEQSQQTMLTTSRTTHRKFAAGKTEVLDSPNQKQNLVQDFNNDGFADVLQFGGDQPCALLLGNGSSLVPKKLNLDVRIVDCDYDDFDGDGLVDLVAVTDQGKKLEVFQNVTMTSNNWFSVQVCGINSNFPKGRVNNHAIGSLIELKAGDLYRAVTVKKPRLYFGLGKNSQIDIIRFLWTSAIPQSLFQVKSGQVVYEEMFEKGSCPYIYTWDGEKFTFFSDCLWAAPLGLQSARGQFIPCRNWEYLKVPGEIVKPKNGQYVFQFTEELREAAYFDLIELYAVDHPADTEIYTNEKVGPPFIAQHQIHTVKNRRIPVSAVDQFGRDVLEEIRTKDGRYFKGFKNRIGKGLAPLHFIELDLGDLAAEMQSTSQRKLTLFLNGWIRPTDCSLNISYSQNPTEPSPVPPVILVPDQEGNWTKVIDPMGFPGGKPKTIAVDLTNAFLSDQYRLRIQTSHEIFWDEIFFTLNDEETEVRQTKLTLSSADLHYRGFSKRFHAAPDAPEMYDYTQVNQTPRWPAMSGCFTRYGNVQELLSFSDDCSAVIGAGDEITVMFQQIADPPAGWKRDFVLHLVGYDKDADLNTVTGQTVEPLPFNGMSRYPYGPADEFPQTEKHRAYLKKFQTRQQNWNSYWSSVSPTDLE